MSRRPNFPTMLLLFTLSTVANAQQVAPPTTAYGAPVSLDAAKRAATAARNQAGQIKVAMAIVVVDPAGQIVYAEKMDGVQNASFDVAVDKARSSALFRRPTKFFLDGLAKGGDGLRFLALRGAVPSDGGEPLIVDGRIIGAIGVSGGTGDQDGMCARAGSEALSKP